MKLSWNKKIIDIYIFKQVFNPFLIGIFLVSVIVLSGILYELADLIIVKNIPIIEVLELLLYQIPEVIVTTFPIAILFATIYGLGRLNRDNEFTALRMGGISLYRLIVPLIVLGIFISGLTYVINEEVVPWTNHRARNIIRLSILQQPMPDVQEDVFFEGPDGRLFYVREFNEQTSVLENIVVFEFPNRRDLYPDVLTAREGRLVENVMELKQGIMHKYDQDGRIEIAWHFENMSIEVARDVTNLFGRQRTPREMSRQELKGEIDLFRRSGLSVVSLLVDYHMKLAIPFIPLIFILIGTPLSLVKADSKSKGVVFTIIIVLCYYTLVSVFRSFGRNEMINPLLAAWFPNIIFTILGIILIYWRSSWKNWIKKIVPFIFVFILLISSYPENVYGKGMDIEAEQLQFDQGTMEATGNVHSYYKNMFIQADKIIIKHKDGEKEVVEAADEIMEINFETGKMSGCDFDKPHYFFKAREAVIYPGDYLIAKHVVFYELSGRLPLFYWPYLYINLKEEDEGLIPEFGYSGTRGWFIKATYNYLPPWGWGDSGSLFLDYFTRTGFAGGIQHYLKRTEDSEAVLYFYTQQNKADVPGLFNMEASFNYFDLESVWNPDTGINYISYDEYNHLEGYAEIEHSSEDGKRKANLQAEFEDIRYSEETDKDETSVEVDFDYKRVFGNNWEFYTSLERELFMEPEEETKSRWSSENYLKRRTRDYMFEIIVEREQPELSKSDDTPFHKLPEINFTYHLPYNFDYGLSVGRYFEDDPQDTVERLSNELFHDFRKNLTKRISFRKNQGVIHNLYRTGQENNIDYLSQHVYETKTSLGIDITRNLELSNTYSYKDFWGERGPLEDLRISPRNEIENNLNYKRGPITVDISGGYDIYNEEYFDIEGEFEWQVTRRIKTGLKTTYDMNNKYFEDMILSANYRDRNLRMNSSLTYDLYNKEYDEMDFEIDYSRGNWDFNSYLEHEFGKQSNLEIGTGYETDHWFINSYLEHEFIKGEDSDLTLSSGYKGNSWEINSGIKYNLADRMLEEWESKLIIERENNWYLEMIKSYDYEDKLSDLDIILKKNFHCRELWFSYNYDQQQFMVEYHINLMPEHGFTFGHSQDESFIFDLGFRELIGGEDE